MQCMAVDVSYDVYFVTKGLPYFRWGGWVEGWLRLTTVSLPVFISLHLPLSGLQQQTRMFIL